LIIFQSEYLDNERLLPTGNNQETISDFQSERRNRINPGTETEQPEPDENQPTENPTLQFTNLQLREITQEY
jgi:hypothetical protein